MLKFEKKQKCLTQLKQESSHILLNHHDALNTMCLLIGNENCSNTLNLPNNMLLQNQQ